MRSHPHGGGSYDVLRGGVETRWRYRLVYDAVGTGMWLYSRAAFRVQTFGSFDLRPGTVVVATHRADTDVPLICASYYFLGGLWRRTRYRLRFAARDDLFEPGVLAALAPGLPLPLRRLLFRLDIGSHLRSLTVLPIRSRLVMRYAQALRTLPAATPLEGLLPPPLLAELGALAARHGLARPRTVGEALRAELVDVLWESAPRDELADARFDDAWLRRDAAATADVRRLVELLRAEEPLLLFPEGVPSRDGMIGPLRRGLALLVRRGRVRSLAPLGVAYDPLTTGRPRAYVAVGDELAPAGDGLEDGVLGALKLAVPLTCGQVLARELVRRAEAGEDELREDHLDAALASAVETSLRVRRRFDPSFRDPRVRRARVQDALRALADVRLVARTAGGRVLVDVPRLLADARVLRLAREYVSAHRLDSK